MIWRRKNKGLESRFGMMALSILGTKKITKQMVKED